MKTIWLFGFALLSSGQLMALDDGEPNSITSDAPPISTIEYSRSNSVNNADTKPPSSSAVEDPSVTNNKSLTEIHAIQITADENVVIHPSEAAVGNDVNDEAQVSSADNPPESATHNDVTSSGAPDKEPSDKASIDSLSGVTEPEVKGEKVIAPAETRFWLLDWSQEFATGSVETLNDGVDSFFMGAFFDDELIEDESSGSNGRLFFTTRRVEDQGVDYKVGINLKLVLPKTRDRFKLLVETDDNEDGEAETDVLNTADNVTYTTAVRVELHDGKRWKSSLDNGVRWEGEPVYFSRLRNRRTDYFDIWRSRMLHGIYWRTDIEWGSNFAVNLLRPLTDHSHFSTGFNADYIVNNDYADLETDVAVFHQVNDKSAMLYQLAILGDTERLTQVNEYVFTVSYRRKIYRHFVFAEIVPEMAWPKEENFEAIPALNFRLEMIFGTHFN